MPVINNYSSAVRDVFVAAFQKPVEGEPQTGAVLSPANISAAISTKGPTGAVAQEGHMAATPAKP